MPDIFIAAIISTALAAIVIGGLILARAPRKLRPALWLAFFAYIPIYWAAFYLIRMPLESLIGPIMEPYPGAYRLLYMFYAPLIEEPAKWSLLLIPWFVRKIDRDSYVRVALAIGLGFGIGEMWMLAVELYGTGTLSQFAWYELSGFINERFIVCMMHGGFVALTLRYMRTKLALGMFLAVGLHFVGNFPIYLLRTDFLSLGEEVWMVIVGIWITVFFLGMILMLAYFVAENRRAGKSLFGLAKCPDCGTIYPRPLLVGVNLVTYRYEPCPKCGKWHLTEPYKPPKGDPNPVEYGYTGLEPVRCPDCGRTYHRPLIGIQLPKGRLERCMECGKWHIIPKPRPEGVAEDEKPPLLGYARCPGCGEIYRRPFFAVNLHPRRYERCPRCKKWHMTEEYAGE